LNAILAPMVFDALLEYPLMIAVACILLPRLGLSNENPWTRMVDIIVPSCLCAFGIIAAVFFLFQDAAIREYAANKVVTWQVSWGDDAAKWISTRGPQEQSHLHHERGFFGVVRVRSYNDLLGEYHYLQHGNINHGLQRVKFSANGETTVYAP